MEARAPQITTLLFLHIDGCNTSQRRSWDPELFSEGEGKVPPIVLWIKFVTRAGAEQWVFSVIQMVYLICPILYMFTKHLKNLKFLMTHINHSGFVLRVYVAHCTPQTKNRALALCSWKALSFMQTARLDPGPKSAHQGQWGSFLVSATDSSVGW